MLLDDEERLSFGVEFLGNARAVCRGRERERETLFLYIQKLSRRAFLAELPPNPSLGDPLKEIAGCGTVLERSPTTRIAYMREGRWNELCVIRGNHKNDAIHERAKGGEREKKKYIRRRRRGFSRACEGG